MGPIQDAYMAGFLSGVFWVSVSGLCAIAIPMVFWAWKGEEEEATDEEVEGGDSPTESDGESSSSSVAEDDDDVLQREVIEDDEDEEHISETIAHPETVASSEIINAFAECQAQHIDIYQSRVEELDIISSFRKYQGLNFTEVEAEAQKRGYTLYILFVGNEKQAPRSSYDPKTLGVRVRSMEEPIVTDFIDVGGTNRHNRV